MSSENRRSVSSRVFRRNLLILGTCLLAGVVVTVALFDVLLKSDWKSMRQDFTSHAKRRADAIQSVIKEKEYVLLSLRAFYDASIYVERHEFTTCTCRFQEQHEEITALMWMPKVNCDERKAFEMQAMDDGIKGFQFVEKDDQGRLKRASVRNQYFPVYYVEPYEGNRSILGYDAGSDTEQLDLFQKIRDTGEAAATSPLRVMEQKEGVKEHGCVGESFLISVPVYNSPASDSTREERRENFRGFLVGRFSMEELVKNALAHVEPVGIDIQLLFGPEGSGFLNLDFSRDEQGEWRHKHREDATDNVLARLCYQVITDVAGS
ncbi:MAG: CHASE domain-containing protein, partial [Planctomycetota bacterium]